MAALCELVIVAGKHVNGARGEHLDGTGQPVALTPWTAEQMHALHAPKTPEQLAQLALEIEPGRYGKGRGGGNAAPAAPGGFAAPPSGGINPATGMPF